MPFKLLCHTVKENTRLEVLSSVTCELKIGKGRLEATKIHCLIRDIYLSKYIQLSALFICSFIGMNGSFLVFFFFYHLPFLFSSDKNALTLLY